MLRKVLILSLSLLLFTGCGASLKVDEIAPMLLAGETELVLTKVESMKANKQEEFVAEIGKNLFGLFDEIGAITSIEDALEVRENPLYEAYYELLLYISENSDSEKESFANALDREIDERYPNYFSSFASLLISHYKLETKDYAESFESIKSLSLDIPFADVVKQQAVKIVDELTAESQIEIDPNIVFVENGYFNRFETSVVNNTDKKIKDITAYAVGYGSDGYHVEVDYTSDFLYLFLNDPLSPGETGTMRKYEDLFGAQSYKVFVGEIKYYDGSKWTSPVSGWDFSEMFIKLRFN